MSTYDAGESTAPPGETRPGRRTATQELGRILGCFLGLFDVVRPLVFAGGLGAALMGLGETVRTGTSGGPEMMGWGGILIGISLPAWRRVR